MRNSIPSYVRVPVAFFSIFALIEFSVDSGDEPAFMKYPLILLFLVLILMLIIAIEAIVTALENVMFQSLDEEQKSRYLARSTETPRIVIWMRINYKKLVGTKPLEKEGELVLDHNYDGIRELDNDLPPWWLYGFYASIIFAAIYVVRFEVFNGDNQYDELEANLTEAKLQLEEYKKTAKDLVDFNTVVILEDPSDLSNRKQIFRANCVACHIEDGGGGIGPNLTDNHWINGGGIKNVFHTISEGGRAGKGMIAWKQSLKPAEMAQVASYVLSLQGTTPANPKEAQGDIWTPEDAASTDAK